MKLPPGLKEKCFSPVISCVAALRVSCSSLWWRRPNVKFCFKLWKKLQKHTSCLKLFIELKLDLVRFFVWRKSCRRDVRTSRWLAEWVAVSRAVAAFREWTGGQTPSSDDSWWRASCTLRWRQSCSSDASRSAASQISSFCQYSESQRDDQATALSPDLSPGGLSVFLKVKSVLQGQDTRTSKVARRT